MAVTSRRPSRDVISSDDYAHFDEWWGPYHYSRGWETMGDVLTRLAEEEGSVIMSKQKLAFAEALPPPALVPIIPLPDIPRHIRSPPSPRASLSPY